MSSNIRIEQYDLWLMDSGYGNHMIGTKIMFSRLDNSFKIDIKLGYEFLVNVEENELPLFWPRKMKIRAL